MAEQFRIRTGVIRQEQIAAGIFSMWLDAEEIARRAVPGQFVSVYSNDRSRLLPRPISICEAEPDRGAIRLVYRVAGAGTEEFSHCQAGDILDLAGPLGNGFPLHRMDASKKAFLMGGGIGIPPMVQLAKALHRQLGSTQPVQIVCGFQDELFLTEELKQNGSLYVATMTGRTGVKGNVLDCVRENALTADVIYACGPAPMLKALKVYAQEQSIECWLSMEQRMACGIGACLACVCKSTETDSHSKVKNKRVCAEGPVFLSTDIEL